jgi:hypothetical protein
VSHTTTTTATALALALTNATATATTTTTATNLANATTTTTATTTLTTTVTTTSTATATATANATTTATATATTLATATAKNVEGNVWVTGKLLAAVGEDGWWRLIFLTADFCLLIFVFERVRAKRLNCNSVHWSAFMIPHNFHFGQCLLHCLFVLMALAVTMRGLTSPLAPLSMPICASPERSGWVVVKRFFIDLPVPQSRRIRVFSFGGAGGDNGRLKLTPGAAP